MGQDVFDERGERCTVVGVYPQGRATGLPGQYLITNPSSGPEPGSPWVTLTHAHRAKIHRETRVPRAVGISSHAFHHRGDCRTHLLHESGTLVEAMHTIPLALPLQLPKRHLPIDPYLLGLWLGDGASVAPDITCDMDDEPHYRTRALAAGEHWRIRELSGGPNGKHFDLHHVPRS